MRCVRSRVAAPRIRRLSRWQMLQCEFRHGRQHPNATFMLGDCFRESSVRHFSDGLDLNRRRCFVRVARSLVLGQIILKLYPVDRYVLCSGHNAGSAGLGGSLPRVTDHPPAAEPLRCEMRNG